MLAKLLGNPTRIAAGVSSLIALGVAYGLKISADQSVAIMAVVAWIANEFVRGAVSPTAAPDTTPAQVAQKLATADAIRAAVAPPVQSAIGGVVNVPQP